jgi:hypothetical protein
MDVTKSTVIMATKLERIAALSRGDSRLEFKWLMPHFSEENLTSCFNALDGKKAVGIDGKTKYTIVFISHQCGEWGYRSPIALIGHDGWQRGAGSGDWPVYPIVC